MEFSRIVKSQAWTALLILLTIPLHKGGTEERVGSSHPVILEQRLQMCKVIP